MSSIVPTPRDPLDGAGLPALRRETLQDALLASVDLLRRRRASDIPEGYIDDYVTLRWLEWHGGGLRVTTVGENICSRITAQLQAAAPASAERP